MRLGKNISRAIIVLYLAATLLVRFILEPQLAGNMVISIALGAFALLFLYALVKSGILNPQWFTFEKDYKKSSS
jgi:hypothetical protein